MKLPDSRASHWLLTVASGALSVLCFAPFRQFWLMPLLLALLFSLALAQPRARQAAGLGALWGLSAYTANFYWIYISLHDVGGMPAWLALPMTLLLPAYLCLYPALALGLAHRLGAERAWWTLPALWTLSEWLRATVMTGFPWGNIGYSQIPEGPLAGWAPVGGVYLVAAWVALSAAALAHGARHGLRRAAPALALGVLVWLAGMGLKTVSWTEDAGELDVALLQGNIAQEMKWRPETFAHTLQTYQQLLDQYPARVVILPETAIPLFADQAPPGVLAWLADSARAQGSELVTGIPYQDPQHAERYYNAVLALTSPQPVYGKNHLVPFGEFVPLPWLTGWVYRYLNMPLAGFSSGGAVQAPMQLAGHRLAFNICYEDSFGDELRAGARQAEALVNLSNLAWFGHSTAADQHLQLSQTRALETGRPMLRATNTGATAVVRADGSVQARLADFTTGGLRARVETRRGQTPYLRLGDLPILLASLLVLALAIWRRLRG